MGESIKNAMKTQVETLRLTVFVLFSVCIYDLVKVGVQFLSTECHASILALNRSTISGC